MGWVQAVKNMGGKVALVFETDGLLQGSKPRT
jgi:hypothetical protein